MMTQSSTQRCYGLVITAVSLPASLPASLPTRLRPFTIHHLPVTSHKAAPAIHAALDDMDAMDCAGRGVLRGCLGIEGAVLDGLEADGGGDAEDFVVGGAA